MKTNRRNLFVGKLGLAAAVLLLAVTSGQAQTASVPQAASPDPKALAYDVVSIKLNKTGGPGSSIGGHNGDYAATNVSLKVLLLNAYDIKEDLISGVSGSLDSARFDILAKIVEPDLDILKKLTNQQRRSMLLSILTERFQLKAHTEARILPVYELVVLKDGPKFKPSPADSQAGESTSVNSNGSNSVLAASSVTMTSFAKSLAYPVKRTIIDKTNLPGNYDLTLNWSPDTAADPQASSAPSIFTAIQEQLGLKLQSSKGPVETLVVDHIEMPSEN